MYPITRFQSKRSPLALLATELFVTALLLTAGAACGTLLAQSAMFPNTNYNVYGRGLYLDNYAELYGITARSRGYAANVYPTARPNYQTFGSRANNYQGGAYQGGYYQGGYIQNYNSTPYYDPYRNN